MRLRLKKKNQSVKLRSRFVSHSGFAFIDYTNQIKFLIIEYNILESSSASFNIVSSSVDDIFF